MFLGALELGFLRLILLIIIIYLLYKFLWKKPKNNKYDEIEEEGVEEEMKKDPVCGTYIPISLAIKYKYKGKTYYFCSQECKEKFISSKKS